MQSRKFSVTTDVLKRIITGSGLDEGDKINSEVIPFCTEEDIEKLSSTTVVSPADVNKVLNKFPISIEAGGTGRTDGTVVKADYADTAGVANEIDWSGVKNAPNQFPVEAHFHTDDTLHSLDSSKLLGTIGTKRFPVGNKGDVIISTEDENVVGLYPINITSYVCESAEEVTKCKNNKPSMQDLFLRYSRISHSNRTNCDAITNPGGYPAAPSELLAWEYKKNENIIYNTTNSCSLIGLISPDKYTEYNLDVIIKSTNNDDDVIGVIAAFAKDAQGKEHTLSFWRSPGGNGRTWSCEYDLQQGTAWAVANKSNVIRWGNGNSGSTAAEAEYTSDSGHGWGAHPNGTRIVVSRRGNIITATTSQLDSTTLVNTSTITIDLTSDSRLQIFTKPCSMGYCTFSQPNSSWYINSFIDPSQRIYDVETNVIWEYNTTAGEWEKYSTNKTIMDLLVPGRYVYNPVTYKLFYIRETFVELVADSFKPDTVEYANKWSQPRNIAISGAVIGTATELDGSKDITIPTTEVKAEYITGTLANNTTGNAATATKLQIARKINTVSFDGTKDITIYDSTKLPLVGGKLTGPINFDGASKQWSNILTSSDGSLIYQNNYSGYSPTLNLKTNDGRVGIGTYQSGLYVTYFNDDNTTNTPENQFIITADQISTTKKVRVTGEIIAPGGVTGNASSATKLATARNFNIAGAVTSNTVAFDGTKNITLSIDTLDASKLTGTASVNTTGNAATATNAVNATNATNATNANVANVSKMLGVGGGTSGMIFNWSGQGGQPSWLWGGNDPANMYVYNPSNFNVSYSNSSNYSNSSGWASGAGYADNLRINGAVVSSNSVSVQIATYNRHEYDQRNDIKNAYFYFDCAGFSKTEGAKIIIQSNVSFSAQFVENIYFNINNTGNVKVAGNHVSTRMNLFVYTGGTYVELKDNVVFYNCQCDDSRCGDDGF